MKYLTIKLLASLLFTFLISSAFAQNQVQISLLDQDTKLAIQDATFSYGNQKGVSDDKGVIQFILLADQPMQLSHINYGNWTIDAQSLSLAVQHGVFFQENLTQDLYPVTIISVQGQQNPSQDISLAYQDHLAHDGAAILNQTPAINSIRKSGGYGFDPVFRGFKYDQLNIVLNGAQSATAACPNRMDPPTSQMAPNMMDRIEILKGPHALRYGSGFGATINFVPTSLHFTNQTDLYGRVSSAYETNGNITRTEGQLGLSGKTYDLSLFTAWAQGNDYTTGNNQSVPANFQRGSFGTHLGLKPSQNQEVRISALYNRARDAEFAALPMDLRSDDTWLLNASHQVNFHHGALSQWNTSLFGSFVDHVMDNLDKELNPRMMDAETAAQTFNYGGRTEGTWKFDHSRLYAGADLRMEGAEGIRTRSFLMGPNTGKSVEDNVWQKSQISKTGIFAEYHFELDHYKMILSSRLEYNHALSNDLTNEFSTVNADTEVNQINPSVSFGVTRRINEGFKMGLWLGRVQRSGSLTERYINFFPVGQDPYEIVGNPDVQPEVNNQMDLTFEWKTENTVMAVDIFASYMQDYISSLIAEDISPRLPTSPGVRRVVNIDEAFKSGFETSWTQKLALGLQQQLAIAYTFAQDLAQDQPLPEIAPLDLRYTLTGQYLDGKLRPEVQFRYVSKQDRISPEFGETVTPSFKLLDFRLGYQIRSNLGMNVALNNVFNEAYYEHLNRSVRGTTDPIYAPGRSFTAAVNFKF